MHKPGGTTAVLVARLAGRELTETQPGIYDRPIGITRLYEDPRSGAEHFLIRYPEGFRATRHRHSAAHTIVVLEGVLEANGQRLPAGSYAHFPAGTSMHHQPAPGNHCLFVIIFDGPFDVEPLGEDEPGGSADS